MGDFETAIVCVLAFGIGCVLGHDVGFERGLRRGQSCLDRWRASYFDLLDQTVKNTADESADMNRMRRTVDPEVAGSSPVELARNSDHD